MPQPRIGQITGLTTALTAKVDSVRNEGNGNVSVADNITGSQLNLFTLNFNTGFSTPVYDVGNTRWNINLNTGVGAGKIPALDSSSRYPAADGSLITNLTATSLVSGPIPLNVLGLASNQMYVGDGSNHPAPVTKSSISISDFGLATGNIDIGTNHILTSASTFTSGQLISFDYAQNVEQNQNAKASCVVSTTGANITLSGFFALDSYTIVNGDRVLVKDQTDTTKNGIWIAASGPWTRAPDADTWIKLIGAYLFIEQGTLNTATGFICNIGPTGVVESNTITWTQFSVSGTLSGSNGITVVNNVISSRFDNTSIYINSSNQFAVKSSATAGQSLISGGAGTSASWGALNLATPSVFTGTLPLANGGLGFSSIAQNTLVGAVGGTSLDNLSVPSGTVVGRDASGNVAALSGAIIRRLTNTRPKLDTGNATNGSMVLLTLTQTPVDPTALVILFNGLELTQTTDYTISTLTINATTALNSSYGGSGSDGQGFSSSDVISAIYSY